MGADRSKVRTPMFTGPYVGQSPPGIKPKMFGVNFISTELPQLDAVFHPNGKEFYYSVETSKYAAILVTREVNNVWSKPKPVSFSGQYREVDLFIARDGSKLLYCSYRPLNEGDSIRGNPDIWMVERDEDNWGTHTAPR